MTKFYVRVERSYTARHYLDYAVEAESQEEAEDLVQEALDDEVLDPTEEPYEDSQEDGGYDDAGPWSVADDQQATPLNAVDLPAYAYQEEG